MEELFVDGAAEPPGVGALCVFLDAKGSKDSSTWKNCSFDGAAAPPGVGALSVFLDAKGSKDCFQDLKFDFFFSWCDSIKLIACLDLDLFNTNVVFVVVNIDLVNI